MTEREKLVAERDKAWDAYMKADDAYYKAKAERDKAWDTYYVAKLQAEGNSND